MKAKTYSDVDKIVRECSAESAKLNLRKLAIAFENLRTTHSCLVHCMQPHHPKFYNYMCSIYNVHIIPVAANNINILDRVGRLIVGDKALILIETADQLVNVFECVTEQSMGGVYFFSNKNPSVSFSPIVGDIESRRNLIFNDPTHVMYVVDEDSSSRDDVVIEIISVGQASSEEFLKVLGVTRAGQS